MISCGFGQGASRAANKDLAILTFDSRLAPEAGKNFNCVLEPLFEPGGTSYCMSRGQAMTHLAQDRFQLLRAKARLKLSKNLVEERAIRLWKELLALGRQFIREMRLAKAWPLAALADDPITFQRGEVRPNCVVGQAQRLGQLGHRARPPAAEAE